MLDRLALYAQATLGSRWPLCYPPLRSRHLVLRLNLSFEIMLQVRPLCDDGPCDGASKPVATHNPCRDILWARLGLEDCEVARFLQRHRLHTSSINGVEEALLGASH